MRSLTVFCFVFLLSKVLHAQDPIGAHRFTNQMMHDGSVSSIAFSPDGKTVLSGSWDNTLKLWNVATGQEIRTLKGHTNWVSSVAFSPDGKTVLSGSLDNTLKLWNVATGQIIRTLKGHTSSVYSVAFSPDGKTVLSGSSDNTLMLWNVVTGQEIRTLKGHTSSVHSVAFSPDGKTVLSGSLDNTLKLWNVATGQEIRTLKGHTSSVHSVAFSPDGKTVLSGSLDNTLKLWNVATGQEIRTLKGHTSSVRSVAFSPDGKTVLSGSSDNTLKLWNVATGQEIRTLKGHISSVHSVAFSPDGKTVLSGSLDNTLKLWNVVTGQEIRTLKGHTELVFSVAFSSDGKTLLSGSEDNTLKLWNVATGQEIRTLKGHTSSVHSVAFSPDGKTVLSGSSDNTLKLWNVATGQEIRTLKGHTSGVSSVAFSPDGKTVLSGSLDNTLKLWNVATGQIIRTLKGHTELVHSVAFSPDGKTVLSGSSDNTLKLWEVATGQEIRTLKGHTSGVSSVAFSPDGKTVLSGSDDNILKLWDSTTGEEIKRWDLNLWPEAVAFTSDGKAIVVGTSAYWVTFPVPETSSTELIPILAKIPSEPEKVKPNSSPVQPARIIWTSPNARRYQTQPLKVNQDRLNLEAVISSSLSEANIHQILRVYVNNKLQTGKLGNTSLSSSTQQQDFDFEQSVTLEEGQNTIVIALAPANQSEIHSLPLRVIYTPPLKANLYLLTFGIQFADLSLTDEDAVTINQLFKAQEGSLFNQVFAEGPFIKEATNTYTIAQEFEKLGNRVDIRPQDVLLVFGSSHGDVINDDFRILGRDYSPASPRRSSLSFREDVIANLDKLDCKKIILLDACHSGVAVGKRLADANRLIANTPSGTVTITSSTGNERSYEHASWGNSAFVKAIREALEEGRANTDGDRYVTLRELYDYLVKRVPLVVKSVKELKDLSQTPQMKMEGMADFPIYLLKLRSLK